MDTEKLINVLYRARYAFVIHGGLTVRCEGSEWQMDFTKQIAEIDEALELLGFDLSKPMLAPPFDD